MTHLSGTGLQFFQHPYSDGHGSALPAPAPARLLPGLVLAVVVMLIDVASPNVNLSILYGALFLWIAPAFADRRIRWPAAVLVLLTFMGFIVKVLLWPDDFRGDLIPRLLNRLFVATILGLLVPAVRTWYPARPQAGAALPQKPSDDFDDLFRSLLPIVVIVLAAVFVAVVAVTDLIVPSSVNMAILYVVPLFIASWIGRRPVLWAAALVMVTLALTGLVLGPPAAITAAVHSQNRVLSVAVLLVVALVLHREMASPGRAP